MIESEKGLVWGVYKDRLKGNGDSIHMTLLWKKEDWLK